MKFTMPRAVRPTWDNSILAFVVVSHSFALLAFGATYWFDSILYFDLSSFIQSGDLLTGYYMGSPGRYMFQHTGLGIPMLWTLIYELFKSNAWIVFAIVQRSFAVGAILFTLNSFKKFLPGPFRFTAAVMICLNPFYQSMHNAVLTESMAGSLILIFSGLTIRFFDKQKIRPHLLFPLFLIAPTIRSEMIIIVPSLFLVHLFRKQVRLTTISLISLSLLGFSLAPLIRYYYVGELIFPNSDYVNPIHAVQTLDKPSIETRRYLENLDFPSGWKPSYESLRRMNYRDVCITWNFYLKEKGFTDIQVRSYFRELTGVLLADPNSLLRTKISGNLPTLGIVHFGIQPENEKIYGEMTQQEYLVHHQNHLKWLSWDKVSYAADFSSFVSRYRTEVPNPYREASISQMETSIGPNIESISHLRKLFFILKLVPTDFLTLGAMISAAFSIFAPQTRKFSIILMPVIVKFLILVRIGTGDIRYSYEFLPVATILTLSLIYQVLRKIPRQTRPKP